MGACLGTGSEFATAPATTPTEALAQSGAVGTRVQVVGRVVPCGSLLLPPFGPDPAVMVKVRAELQSEQLAAPKKVLFRAFDAVNFQVSDGANEVLVDLAGGDCPSSSGHLAQTHRAINIMRQGGDLVSGGEKQGEYSQVVPRPHAGQFWKDFGAGRDNWAEITHVNKGGQNRPRVAVEHSLRPGDAVSVVGVLARGEDGTMRLTGKLAVANLPSTAPHIKGVQGSAAETDWLSTCEATPMRHKKKE